MVVVGIIAILLAIAIPTFLATRGKAQDKSAQSSLRNTLTAAKTLYADTNDYTKADTTALTAAEKSVTFQSGASTGPTVVSVGSATTNNFYAAAKSDSTTCYYIRDVLGTSATGTQWSSGTGTCDAATAAGTTLTWRAAP